MAKVRVSRSSGGEITAERAGLGHGLFGGNRQVPPNRVPHPVPEPILGNILDPHSSGFGKVGLEIGIKGCVR